MERKKRALLSVYSKDGIEDFARSLIEMDWEIISSGGTARVLQESGIEVIDVAEVTGFPAMLGHRVVTLHPMVHGGILMRRGHEGDERDAERFLIHPIDMVVVNLYPFDAVIADPACTQEEAIENIDIGGPTLIRAAAKNFRWVAVVTDPGQYAEVLDNMESNGGVVSGNIRLGLATWAFALTRTYDSSVLHFMRGRALAYGDGGEDFMGDGDEGW
jgi:phosphoribosylaminoimidazolecarboxamide formyltransferase/IMP cyclohydrolase